MTATATAQRSRDLPALWDGRRVQWDPFEVEPVAFICDRSKRKDGLILPHLRRVRDAGPRLRSVGLLDPEPGATVEGEVLRIHRNGRPVHAMEPARPLRTLHATRCQTCGHDQVYDLEIDVLWDLDESDYGPEGSTAP